MLQAIIAANDLCRAAAHGVAGIFGAAAAAAVTALSLLWAQHIGVIAAWAQAHVGLTLAIIFVVMWIATLALIPIAAIMGIVGVVSSALFVGLGPSLSAASTEVSDFLGNPQLATLPLDLPLRFSSMRN